MDPLEAERSAAKDGLKVDTNSKLYSYVNQSNFTSEIFKLEVKGLPKHVGFSEMKNFFKQQNLNHHKVKLIKARSSGFHTQCFITFLTLADKEIAFEKLPSIAFKGRKLTVHEANPHKDPHEKKLEEDRNKAGDEESGAPSAAADGSKIPSKKPKRAPLPEISPVDRVAAYNMFPYEEQLKKKTDLVENVLVDLSRKITPNLPRHVRDKEYMALKKIDPATGERVKYTFQFKKIISDPEAGKVGYRNKCEFTIGENEAEPPQLVVGFRGSNYSEKPNLVCDLEGDFKTKMERFIVPETMVSCANRFRDLIRKLPYKSFNEKDFTGYWRTITIRYSDQTDDMILGIETQDSVIRTQIQKCRERIANLEKDLKDQRQRNQEHSSTQISTFQSKIEKLTSQLVNMPNEHVDLIREEMSTVKKLRSCLLDSEKVIFGDKIWTEKIYDYVFEISPESFFQVNRAMCERLYLEIKDEILKGDKVEGKENILLDICCGTGTIGISLSKNFKKVVGLEIVPEAVENAKKNAKINNIENVEFITGPAEATLPEAIKPYHDTDKFSVSAILDPPRNGLHHSLITNIRTCTPIRRLVYVSCNISAKRAIENFCDLTRDASKRIGGERFTLKSVTPVDMFPNTNHVENILVFER